MEQTRQDIILIEVLELKPVQSSNVRKLLNRIDELRCKCNQCGGTPLGGNAIKRMLVKCVPRGSITPWRYIWSPATTFQQARKLVMRQMHDEFTGMLEGDQVQPLYNLEAAEEDNTEEVIGALEKAKAEENRKRADE